MTPEDSAEDSDGPDTDELLDLRLLEIRASADPEAWDDLGGDLLDEWRLDDAIECFTVALQLGKLDAAFGLALALDRDSREVEAAPMYERAIEAGVVKAILNHGVMLEFLGDREGPGDDMSRPSPQVTRWAISALGNSTRTPKISRQRRLTIGRLSRKAGPRPRPLWENSSFVSARQTRRCPGSDRLQQTQTTQVHGHGLERPSWKPARWRRPARSSQPLSRPASGKAGFRSATFDGMSTGIWPGLSMPTDVHSPSSTRTLISTSVSC